MEIFFIFNENGTLSQTQASVVTITITMKKIYDKLSATNKKSSSRAYALKGAQRVTRSPPLSQSSATKNKELQHPVEYQDLSIGGQSKGLSINQSQLIPKISNK